MKAKYNNVYISDDDKKIIGAMNGIKKVHKLKNGFIFEFDTPIRACKSAQVLIESGYETVRVI